MVRFSLCMCGDRRRIEERGREKEGERGRKGEMEIGEKERKRGEEGRVHECVSCRH